MKGGKKEMKRFIFKVAFTAIMVLSVLTVNGNDILNYGDSIIEEDTVNQIRGIPIPLPEIDDKLSGYIETIIQDSGVRYIDTIIPDKIFEYCR